jgi:hypothetical protein
MVGGKMTTPKKVRLRIKVRMEPNDKDFTDLDVDALFFGNGVYLHDNGDGFSLNTLRTEKVWHFSVDSGLQIYLFTGTKKKAIEIARVFVEIDWTGLTKAEVEHVRLRKKIDEKYGWG